MNDTDMKSIPPGGYYLLSPAEYSPLPVQEEKEVHLRDYWKVIQKRKWIVIAFFLIVLTATAVGTFTMEPVYRGTATIQISKENPNIVDFKEVLVLDAMEMDYYQTQYKILESRTLARRVIQALKLSENPEFQPKPQTAFQKWQSDLWASVSGFFGPGLRGKKASQNASPNASKDGKENRLVSHFLAQLKIEPIRNSRLVKVHYDSNSPEFSAQVSNSLAAAYIQQNLENRFVSTEQAREWLGKQLEDLKAKVERADEDLQAFGSRHDIISLDEKENVTMQRLAELNETLTKAEAERMAKEALYKQTQARSFDSFPAILENKLIQDLKQSYIQLEAQYMKLLETFKPEYPEMVRLKNQMEVLQKRLGSEIDKMVQGIRSDYESSLRKEALLRQAFQQQKAKALEMKEKGIQYNILKREADTNRELYKGLLMRMKEAGVSAGITASNIQIVDSAELPRSPYKPNKTQNLLLAAVVGLFLGVGLAFFFEYLDNTIKTPEDLEQWARLPSFGMVPEISSNGGRKRVGKEASCPVELITYGHPKSMLSEAYRSIRTSILLSSSEKPPKKIAVTSPNPGEGKTTTVINTAIALSQTGARVLVIDADMRKPRIHKIFNHENGMGLSNFLSGHGDLESIIKNSEVPNLFYIPAGPIPPNPSELLGSNLFKKMLGVLETRFDHILVDSPPVLGFADAVILSSSVNGVILTVLGGKTPRETLQRAKEALQQTQTKILGVVINRVDIRRSDYGYYYYQYHSYYGEEERKKEIPYVAEERSSSS
jgi:polysaccharide biosynthesis transport protein